MLVHKKIIKRYILTNLKNYSYKYNYNGRIIYKFFKITNIIYCNQCNVKKKLNHLF